MRHQTVTFACGDRHVVFLVSPSVDARERTLSILARSFCPTCQRKSRYAAAYQCAERAELLPLRASCQEQFALAEIIRASLWRTLLPPGADIQVRQFLATLFNRQRRASFWVSLRGWSTYRLSPEQAGCLLLHLLQTPMRGET